MKQMQTRIKFVSMVLSVLILLSALTLSVSATEMSLEDTPVVSMSIDKTLLSEGETATVSVEMQEGYEVEYLVFKKPITGNSYAVYDIEYSDGCLKY